MNYLNWSCESYQNIPKSHYPNMKFHPNATTVSDWMHVFWSPTPAIPSSLGLQNGFRTTLLTLEFITKPGRFQSDHPLSWDATKENMDENGSCSFFFLVRRLWSTKNWVNITSEIGRSTWRAVSPVSPWNPWPLCYRSSSPRISRGMRKMSYLEEVQWV